MFFRWGWSALLAVLPVALLAFLLVAPSHAIAAAGAAIDGAADWQASAYPAPTRMAGLQVLVDDTAGLTVEQVEYRFDAGQGRPVHPDDILPFTASNAVWFQLAFSPVLSPTPLVLSLPQPGLDSVILYRPVDRSLMPVNAAARWQLQRSGDSLPVAAWPMRHLYPTFKVDLTPGEREASYLRVANGYPVSMPWALTVEAVFMAQSQRWQLLLGMYLGGVLFVVALSALLSVPTRDSIYLVFAAYVLILTFGQLAKTGLGGEHLWPRAPWWNDYAPLTLTVAGVAMLHLLLHQFTKGRDVSWRSWCLPIMTAVGSLVAVAFLLLGRKLVYPLLVPYFLVSFAVYLVVGVKYARQRPRIGIWVCAALGCIVTGSVFAVFRLLSLAPTSIATQYGAQLGAALEVPLLLVALYFRSRERRDSEVRLGKAGCPEDAPPLSSYHLLMQRLQRLQFRQQDGPIIGAVMRIRLDNVDCILQEHGVEAAQQALEQVSACISSLARSSDTVAQHRDGDFVLLLDGALVRDQLTAIGQRLIVRGLLHNPALPPHTVLHLKLVVAELQFKTAKGVLLLNSLADVLDELATRPGTALRFFRDTSGLRESRHAQHR